MGVSDVRNSVGAWGQGGGSLSMLHTRFPLREFGRGNRKKLGTVATCSQ